MNEDTMIHPTQEDEVFQRVWQRVMAGRTEGHSPIKASAPSAARRTEAAPSSPSPHGLPRDLPGSDLPPAGMEPPAAPELTARLRQQTLEALEAWQFYRQLARRTRGCAARTLSGLAADQHQLARRLAAFYFIHSGVRYWPCDRLPVPTISSYWGALRQRHQAEQQAELSYRMSVDESCDAALIELYERSAEACRSHCLRLCTLLEQSCP